MPRLFANASKDQNLHGIITFTLTLGFDEDVGGSGRVPDARRTAAERAEVEGAAHALTSSAATRSTRALNAQQRSATLSGAQHARKQEAVSHTARDTSGAGSAVARPGLAGRRVGGEVGRGREEL